ncbi:hypothetical protein Bca4012_013345 [Brassica carinata]
MWILLFIFPICLLFSNCSSSIHEHPLCHCHARVLKRFFEASIPTSTHNADSQVEGVVIRDGPPTSSPIVEVHGDQNRSTLKCKKDGSDMNEEPPPVRAKTHSCQCSVVFILPRL